MNSLDNKYLVLSDIHGNMSAFDAVINDCKDENFAGVILLGDLIDYGMRSNEVINRIKSLNASDWKDKLIVNIWGNHEELIINADYTHLSTERGRSMAKYTKEHLSVESYEYIRDEMSNVGLKEFELLGFKCLAVHGSIGDCYWKAIYPETIENGYDKYDVVLGGHSHCSHCFTHFFPIERAELRNKKAVTFINPGSVGQPRNQNPSAQYAVLHLPSKKVELRAVEYDIHYEQSLYPDCVDSFYKTRLAKGV